MFPPGCAVLNLSSEILPAAASSRRARRRAHRCLPGSGRTVTGMTDQTTVQQHPDQRPLPPVRHPGRVRHPGLAAGPMAPARRRLSTRRPQAPPTGGERPRREWRCWRPSRSPPDWSAAGPGRRSPQPPRTTVAPPPTSSTSVDSLRAASDGSADTSAADGSVEQVAAAVLPSVVSIVETSATGGGEGTGVIIDSDGLILTNNHVVAGAADGGSLRVTFNDGTQPRGDDRRSGPGHRPGRHQGLRRQRPDRRDPGQLEGPRPRRAGRRHRLAAGPAGHRDERHHQRPRPAGAHR